MNSKLTLHSLILKERIFHQRAPTTATQIRAEFHAQWRQTQRIAQVNLNLRLDLEEPRLGGNRLGLGESIQFLRKIRDSQRNCTFG